MPNRKPNTNSNNRVKELINATCSDIDDYGVILLNEAAMIESWNEGAKIHFGYERRSILGKSVSILFDGEKLSTKESTHKMGKVPTEKKAPVETNTPTNKASMAKLLKLVAEKYCSAIKFKTKDSEMIFSMSIETVSERDFHGYLLVVHHKSLSQHKNIQKELTASLTDLIKMLDKRAIATINSQAKITFLNDKATSMFGLKKVEAYKKPIASLFDRESVKLLLSIKQTRSAKKIPAETQIPSTKKIPSDTQIAIRHNAGGIWQTAIEEHKNLLLIKQDGETVSANLLTIFAPQNEKKQPQFVRVLTVQTIDKDVLSINHDKQFSPLELDEWISLFTHDIKNQLLGFKQLLAYLDDEKAGHLNNKQHQIIETIKKSNYHLLSMIEKLVELKENKSTFRHEELDMYSIARECVESFHQTAEIAGVALEIGQAPARSKAEGDKTALKQVVNNLLHNAMKFTPKGGKIIVDVYEEDTCNVIEVKDTGPGISDEIKNQIFNKHASFNIEGYALGSGLGLYLCKKIVASHNGYLSYTSQKNKGANFFLRLPKESVGNR